MKLRLPTLDDLPGLLALNNAHAVELAPETDESFGELVSVAWRVRAVDEAAGMCIAFDQDTDRDSENLNWFRARYERFAYVDRIVVDPKSRGLGLARRFYEDVIEAARAEGHTLLCAEVNLDPPNPASDAFHAAMGFEAVGQAKLGTRDKSVRYFTLRM
ncbi:GNAT family N-acetyltransferase [Stackebrandtia nassauensis]|uniref:GCN5-related N-acetyltransferase n=1 Tax=Stackebrandtia nassauensis (strain DSM 44728 / CIP 108903 / NRRL B-16338 / NBRC 102104 / LLR-40K-21) TaxID=446470 RepID=D3PYZ5_STANL|nr:GNAT family N-acetyltransferase [Stackebrandtia nassauensis]ADD45424.1 GCN5-related N-acetyltransferase [Stackebrandtia nassauensis DSM 44728]